MTNSKPRPNHPVGCNDHYRTRISTVSIFGGLITNQVPTTRLRTTVKSVQRPVPHLSHDAQQQTTSRSLCYLQRSIPYKDPYHIYLPTPNSDGRPDHSVGYNGHYRARISTVSISRRKQQTTSRPHPSSYQQTTSRPPAFVKWPLPYNDQYRTYRPMPSSKPRLSHPVGYNGHYRTRIGTVSIFRYPTTNYVLTTPLRATVSIVKRSVPYLSPDGQQQPMS